jgi:hypothetical protein
VLLISTALFLGFLHGLGADHLMAIAALSLATTGETPAVRRARALGVAVQFAIGHAVLLALGAGTLIALGWSLPLFVERGGEVLGGSLLVLFGAFGLCVFAGRLYGHTHRHSNEPVAHWHLHVGRKAIIPSRRHTPTFPQSSAPRSPSAVFAP